MARLLKACEAVSACRGFTYVGLLIAIVFFGLGSVGVARVLASSERGEKERELMYVGQQFRDAIGSYYASGPGLRRYPGRLEDLLLDARFPTVKRHLRRIYDDPITGKGEWALVMAPEGGIMGVHSLSEREPMNQSDCDLPSQNLNSAAKITDGRRYTYRDWQFVYRPINATSTVASPEIKFPCRRSDTSGARIWSR